MTTPIAKDFHECRRGDFLRQGHAPRVLRVASADEVGGTDFWRTWFTIEGLDHFPIVRWCPYCGEELRVPYDIAAQYREVLTATPAPRELTTRPRQQHRNVFVRRRLGEGCKGAQGADG